MNENGKTMTVLAGLAIVFCGLTLAFLKDLWGHPPRLEPIPLVSAESTNTATTRRSLADLIRAKEDVSDFDCYGCHDPKKPPPIRYDTNHNIILPKEHQNLVMNHGGHHRNNNCFNCHNETNLVTFQTRDGRELKLSEPTPLCGSCHGPTYRDWEKGIHGRTSGSWDVKLGPMDRKDCVSCHDPHAPTFPPRKPAPGPYPLRPGKHPAKEKHIAGGRTAPPNTDTAGGQATARPAKEL